MKYYIGTSGWQYPHWIEAFYPRHLSPDKWLFFYSQYFNSVEINVTFYRNVKPSTCEKWYKTVPENFLFSVKMSRFITHIRKLQIKETSIAQFKNSILPLQDKLGVILIQLPPQLKFDISLLRNFISLLNDRFRYTIEVRNETFVNDRFLSLLASSNIAWCIADSAGRFPYHELITADFVYIRLHGNKTLYTSSYGNDDLKRWKDKLKAWNKDAFVYFDNDFKGYAVKNALFLKKLIDKDSQ